MVLTKSSIHVRVSVTHKTNGLPVFKGGEGVKEIESYQEWKEELERHGKTPEEMVEWARENISEEYAGKLAEVIREYEHQGM